MSDFIISSIPVTPDKNHRDYISLSSSPSGSNSTGRRASDVVSRLKLQHDDFYKSILESLKPKGEYIKDDSLLSPTSSNARLSHENRLLKDCLCEYEQALYLVITKSDEKLKSLQETHKDEKKILEARLQSEKNENEQMHVKLQIMSSKLEEMKKFMENSVEKLENEQLEVVKIVAGLTEENKTLRRLNKL